MSAYRTAMKRSKLSRPAEHLLPQLTGRVLDYGCGKGDDAKSVGCESYDPHYNPVVIKGRFDTIMCNYVLNVIESEGERRTVLSDINQYLETDGVAFITVRTDKKALCGRTGNGTWQGLIELDLPVEHKGSGFTIYRMEKGQNLCEMTATTFDK